MKRVLILCTGNSCRSLMAEALINHYLGAQWLSYSAGTQPTVANPKAIKILQEMGIDTSQLYSKSLVEFLDRDDLDLVITVCDHAKESCPVFSKARERIHIGIEDPAIYSELPDEIALPKFRQTADSIMKEIVAFLKMRS